MRGKSTRKTREEIAIVYVDSGYAIWSSLALFGFVDSYFKLLHFAGFALQYFRILLDSLYDNS